MNTLWMDVRYAVRTLLKTPGFTVAAVLALALGIGANTAIFSIISATLLRSMPYPESDRLVLLWTTEPSRGVVRSQVSATDVADFRTMSRSFADVTTFGNYSGVITGQGTPERLNGTQVGDNFFQILGAKPLLGRFFMPEEQIEGKDQVVILGYELWRTRFGADPQVIGKSILLSQRPYTVVGVLPQDFHPLPPTLAFGHDFYRPVAEKYDNEERSSRHLRAIARLKPDVSMAQADAEAKSIAAKLAAQYRDDRENSASVVSMFDDTYRDVRRTLLVLFVGVSLVLLIACANVGNLLLARSTARRREVAIRAALGATRGRVVRQLLTESAVLAFAGGALGVVLAAWGVSAANLVLPRMAPQVGAVALDARVGFYAILVSLLTALAFGLVPAWQLAGIGVNEQLKEGARSAGTGAGSALRSALLVGEMAMALLLLVGAGLLMKSVNRLLQVNPGFQPHHRISTQLSLGTKRYSKTADTAAFLQEAERRVQALPGVSSAGFVSTMPFLDFDQHGYRVEGRQYVPGQTEVCDAYWITPGYLKAMGVQLLRGRNVNENDTANSQRVVLISQFMANRMFPGEDPIGKGIVLFGDMEHPKYQRVIGVVTDVHQYSLDVPVKDEVYVPSTQVPGTMSGSALIVEAEAAPLTIMPEIRRQLQAMDPDAALSQIHTLDDIVSDSVLSRRVVMFLVSFFAGLAMLLASLGIYSVISYLVRQRTREIGIRMALGARPADIAGMVLRQGGSWSALGIAIGIFAATLLTRLLANLLFKVSPYDPFVFGSVSMMLAAVALLACYVPARRATRVDPMIALRCE